MRTELSAGSDKGRPWRPLSGFDFYLKIPGMPLNTEAERVWESNLHFKMCPLLHQRSKRRVKVSAVWKLPYACCIFHIYPAHTLLRRGCSSWSEGDWWYYKDTHRALLNPTPETYHPGSTHVEYGLKANSREVFQKASETPGAPANSQALSHCIIWKDLKEEKQRPDENPGQFPRCVYLCYHSDPHFPHLKDGSIMHFLFHWKSVLIQQQYARKLTKERIV